jgi:hypothetical protein
MPGLGGSALLVWGKTALCKYIMGEIVLPEGGSFGLPATFKIHKFLYINIYTLLG